jgi:hypothetical protein
MANGKCGYCSSEFNGCEKCDSGLTACLECRNRFYLYNGSCNFCPVGMFCENDDSTTDTPYPTMCQDYQILHFKTTADKSTYDCPTNTKSCLTTVKDDATYKCASCYDGYTLEDDECKYCNIPNCSNCSFGSGLDTLCTECESGYTMSAD